MKDVEYIVVGAGSAGCVLARRLAERGRSVVLLEAGPAAQRSLKVRAPALYAELWRTPIDWAFRTEPQRHVAGRRMFWPRGKLVGGTSCLNSMVYIRGHRDNYDEWRDLGNPGWGWDDVLPLFKRSEANGRGASAYHGGDGLLSVVDQSSVNPVSDAFATAAAKRCGVDVVEDFNSAAQDGFGRYQMTVRAGERASTAVAFLPGRGGLPLEVRAGVAVERVIVEGDRARGVRYRIGGRSEELRASREVVLCGGAIGSPQLLMLSGIGPAEELRRHGIDVVRDAPGVGRNLQDHLCVALIHAATSRAVLAPTMARGLLWIAQYLAGRRGPLATSIVEAGGFVKSRPDAPRPDLQFHFLPFGFTLPNTDEPRPKVTERQVMLLPGLIYPRSAGEIRLASADPAAAPAIDPNYFADDADLAHLVDGIKLSREIAASEPLAAHLGAELHPGPDCKSDEALRDAIRGAVNTIFHPVGTCRMGSGDDAVVDASLRVRGVDGLRVADASVMPRIIGGNTNAPVIMIAEKAADLIAPT